MKKMYFVVFTCVLFFAGGAVFGHSPDKIKARFDTEESALYLEVSHNVRNPENHFIEKITVWLEGDELIGQENIMQEEKTGQEFKYIIPGAKTGDKIKIKAKCSAYGDEETAIEVKEKKKEPEKTGKVVK